MVSFGKILQKLWDVYSSPVESPSTSKEDTNKKILIFQKEGNV